MGRHFPFSSRPAGGAPRVGDGGCAQLCTWGQALAGAGQGLGPAAESSTPQPWSARGPSPQFPALWGHLDAFPVPLPSAPRPSDVQRLKLPSCSGLSLTLLGLIPQGPPP